MHNQRSKKGPCFPPFTAVFGRGLISACGLAYKWGKVGHQTVGRLLYSKQPHIQEPMILGFRLIKFLFTGCLVRNLPEK